MRIDIFEFQKSGKPEKLLDWINTIEEDFEYKGVIKINQSHLLQLGFVEGQQLCGNKKPHKDDAKPKTKKRLTLGKS